MLYTSSAERRADEGRSSFIVSGQKATCGLLLRFRIVLGPEPDEFVEMMRPENGPVARQVIEIVHDDSDEQIDDLIKPDSVRVTSVAAHPTRNEQRM